MWSFAARFPVEHSQVPVLPGRLHIHAEQQPVARGVLKVCKPAAVLSPLQTRLLPRRTRVIESPRLLEDDFGRDIGATLCCHVTLAAAKTFVANFRAAFWLLNPFLICTGSDTLNLKVSSLVMHFDFERFWSKFAAFGTSSFTNNSEMGVLSIYFRLTVFSTREKSKLQLFEHWIEVVKMWPARDGPSTLQQCIVKAWLQRTGRDTTL
jgi:hypothetical protein